MLPTIKQLKLAMLLSMRYPVAKALGLFNAWIRWLLPLSGYLAAPSSRSWIPWW